MIFDNHTQVDDRCSDLIDISIREWDDKITNVDIFDSDSYFSDRTAVTDKWPADRNSVYFVNVIFNLNNFGGLH